MKYWGFRHWGQIMLDVMETFVYTLRELVQEQGCGYDFTIFENESTILLFQAKRVNDFTILGRSRL